MTKKPLKTMYVYKKGLNGTFQTLPLTADATVLFDHKCCICWTWAAWKMCCSGRRLPCYWQNML